MQVEVGIPGGARSQTLAARKLRESIAAAFDAEGVKVDSWSDFVQRGALEDAAPVILVAIALAPVGGLVWDAEKAALQRARTALRRIVSSGRFREVILRLKPEPWDPIDYWIPSGTEGERAFDALEADYATNPPPGPRYWWPGVGWITREETHERLGVGRAGGADQGRPVAKPGSQAKRRPRQVPRPRDK